MLNKKYVFVCCSLITLFFVLYAFGFPDKGIHTCILVEGKPVFVHDGIDLSGKSIPYSRINWNLDELKDVNFSRAFMANSDLDETFFVNCSFRRANLAYVEAPFSTFTNCDFTDAQIAGSNISISKEQLITTISFKHKHFPGYQFFGDVSGLDFSGFDLKGANFVNAQVTNCKFDDSRITGAVIGMSTQKEQIFSTKDFQSGELINVIFTAIDFSNSDLSNMNLTNCQFYYSRLTQREKCNLENVNFENTVISRCNFSEVENLTLEQIKSTWNYKVGRMDGITLPEELQKALDAEKKQ